MSTLRPPADGLAARDLARHLICRALSGARSRARAAHGWYTACLRQYQNLGGTRDTERLQNRITALAKA